MRIRDWISDVCSSDLLADSPYKWEPLFDGLVMVACAFDDWAMIVQFAYRWFALGGGKGRPVTLLADNSDRLIPLASADDYLRQHGDADAGSKARRWIHKIGSASCRESGFKSV